MTDFQLRPFAFMRLTHEALRSGFAAVQTAADAGDLDAARREYEALKPVIGCHARLEEECFFPLLDRLFDDAVVKGGLREAHVREDGHQEAVDKALAAGDADGLRAAITEWAPSFERHLTEEEDLMMPLTGKVGDSLEARCLEVGKIIATDKDGVRTTLLPYVVRQLAAHKPFGPVRMFVASVQAATGDGYDELAPVIKEALPAELSTKLSGLGHLPA